MRYAILTFLWAMAIVAYVQRSAISVPLQEIGRDLAAEATWFGDATRALGFLQSAWHFGYALFPVPTVTRIELRLQLIQTLLIGLIPVCLRERLVFRSEVLDICYPLRGCFKNGIF